MSIVRLSTLLDGAATGELGRLTRRARQQSDLAATLRRVLPPEAAGELVAANARDDGRLVLVCSSPGWAARLRFESADLLAAARIAGVTVQRLEVRVAKGDAASPRGD